MWWNGISLGIRALGNSYESYKSCNWWNCISLFCSIKPTKFSFYKPKNCARKRIAQDVKQLARRLLAKTSAKANSTANLCKHDYSSFFKPRTPEYTLSRNKPNTEPMRVCVCPKHERRRSKQNNESMQVWLCLVLYPRTYAFLNQTEHGANASMSKPKTRRALEINKTLRPCKYDDYTSFFKRVTQKPRIYVTGASSSKIVFIIYHYYYYKSIRFWRCFLWFNSDH